MFSVRRKATALMALEAERGSFSADATEKRVLARISRAKVSPGRPHPAPNRYALASLAFLTAPVAAASSWAECSGVERVMAASEVDRVVAVGGRVLSG